MKHDIQTFHKLEDKQSCDGKVSDGHLKGFESLLYGSIQEDLSNITGKYDVGPSWTLLRFSDCQCSFAPACPSLQGSNFVEEGFHAAE